MARDKRGPSGVKVGVLKALALQSEEPDEITVREESSKEATLRAGGMEEATLRTVMHQDGKGYAVTIKPIVEDLLGKKLTYGGIYTTLDRLEEKGFVESTWGEATSERGGKRKQYFHVTCEGEIALSRVKQAQERMRNALSFIGGRLPEGEVA